MSTVSDTDPIPLHTLVLDREAFERLSPADQDQFLLQARRLEELGYFARQGRATMEWAAIDFSEYADFDSYLAACRKIHTGNAVRDALKSERKGYYSKFFNPRVFAGDIVAVNTSTPERQGSPMAAHYYKSVEERGGYAASLEPEEAPKSDCYWIRHWGIFRTAPGHRQGSLVVDEQLLGYCILRRLSEFLMYSTFLGHWEFLPDGIAYKMHLDLVKTILAQRSAAADTVTDRSLHGARYLFYARYFTVSKGLMMWKRRMLFRPIHFEFDYPRPVSPPSPLATLSLTASRAETDFEASRFDQENAPDRAVMALLDGATDAAPGRPLNLLFALTRPECWVDINSVLIGGSLVTQNHHLLVEALHDCCRRLVPDGPVYISNSGNTNDRVSPAGRNFANWLLGLGRGWPADNIGEMVKTLAPILSVTAHRAFELAQLLQELCGSAAVADVTAIGAGSGVLGYFALAERCFDRGLRLNTVDHLSQLAPAVTELFRLLAEQCAGMVRLGQYRDLAEYEFVADSQDLILFDPAVWRIPAARRRLVFTGAWEALRKGGLLIVNAVVRSDDPNSEDPHDRNFIQAPTRAEMIQLLSFAEPVRLYRYATGWRQPEEAASVAARDYGTDSYLVVERAGREPSETCTQWPRRRLRSGDTRDD